MSPEIFGEKDIEKEFKKGENNLNGLEDKENIDKTSLEFLNKTGEKVYESALKISPEAKKQLEPSKEEFFKNNELIENEFKSGKINEKTKQEKLNNSVKQYIQKITEITGTMEGSQSMQSKKFSDNLEKKQKTYSDKLEDFLKKMQERLNQEQEKKLKDSINKGVEAHKKGNEEAEKSKVEAEKKLTEALGEGGKK